MPQPPKQPRDSSGPPDDDFELRPLQRMHADENDDAAAPPEPASAPLAPRKLEAVPEGMVACASCMQIKPQADVTVMADGRLLCAPCAAAHRRTHAREESRIAAASRNPAWFDLRDTPAWIAVAATPILGIALFTLVMALVRRTQSLPGGSAFQDAGVLMALVLGETVLALVALGLTAMIFSGLDLPTLPNRLWKITALLTLDMAVFVWTGTLWASSPCLIIGYFVAVRPVFLGLGFVVLLGLEALEGAIMTLITWGVVCMALLSAASRNILITRWGMGG